MYYFEMVILNLVLSVLYLLFNQDSIKKMDKDTLTKEILGNVLAICIHFVGTLFFVLLITLIILGVPDDKS